MKFWSEQTFLMIMFAVTGFIIYNYQEKEAVYGNF